MLLPTQSDHICCLAGKSYIGVCLVLALDVIRNAVEHAGFPMGPILVLSYKNHSLDEFLLDIIEHYPKQWRGFLIRTGKPDEEALQGYSERSTPAEYAAQEELGRRLEVQRHTLQVAKDWLDCCRYLETLAASAEAGKDAGNEVLVFPPCTFSLGSVSLTHTRLYAVFDSPICSHPLT